MSVADRLNKLTTDITNAYTSIENKGGTIPANKNTNNLSTAIDSIEVIEQATAEGESLSLTNTKAMPYSDYVVDGKSEQDGEPSPSNPGEIHSVADDVNLFDLKNFLSDRNVSYTENEDGSLTFITSSALYLSPLQFSNEDIIVSMSGILTTLEEMSNAKIEILNSNNTVVGQINLSNSKIENITGSKLRFNITSNKTITLRNIKLQKGTTFSPYSPYNQGTVTIKQRGKNLFDYKQIISRASMSIENGGFVINNTDFQNGYSIGILKNLCPELKVGDKFKFTWDTNATRNNSDVTYIYLSSYANTIRKDITYTCTQEMLDSNTFFYGQQGEYYKNIMFYLDGQTSDYEPYQANDYTIQTEPLRSLPNGVRDTIEADGIHRRVGVKVFTGDSNTEGWSLNNFPNQIDTMCAQISFSKSVSKQNENGLLCDKLKKKILYSLDEEGIDCYTAGGGFVIRINRDRLSSEDLAGLRAYLQSNPITVQYKLAEEIIEPLTQNQATTMLDIIKTGSYEGTTNIYTDEDVKPTMKVDYYKKG